ncbi:N-acetylmuramoyl-L-alanine amidase [Bacteroidota bacterium]|nr:N-acetylmuramoyl-L-alanine amidase [Bacteroidota bacterium]
MSKLINLYHIKSLNVLLAFLFYFNPFFLLNLNSQEIKPLKRVVIDAGHGGKDSGTMGTKRYKTYEKDIALKISLMLGDYIKKNIPEVDVIYTRDDDTFIELRQRTIIANEQNADLFISIHCDGFTNSKASGASVFVMGMSKLKENMDVAIRENSVIYLEDNYKENYDGFDPKSAESYIVFSVMQNSHLTKSINFAEKIEYEFSNKAKRKSRGIKQAPFYVISRANMPAVLIEAGFLTNPKEEDYLNTKEGQSHIASAIFRAFRSYYNEQIDLISEFSSSENKVEIAENVNDSIQKDRVVYKVQIGTYLKSMLNYRTFNKIKDLEEVFVNGSYKYYIRCGDNKQFADEMRKNMINNGFSGSFVTAFYKGKQISTKEALNLQKKYEQGN